MEVGWLDIILVGPHILPTFVVNCAHFLNHSNPLTSASARWALMPAMWSPNPHMLLL